MPKTRNFIPVEISLRLKKVLRQLDDHLRQQPVPTLGLQLVNRHLRDLAAVLKPFSETRRAVEMLIRLTECEIDPAGSRESVRSALAVISEDSETLSCRR